jgi:hypothetical protein
MEHQQFVPGDTPRATRFPLRLRAQYRCEPTRGWHHALTVNVSRTGVLLYGPEPVDVGSLIDIVFRLSHNLLDTPSGAVTCQCRVVRLQPAPDCDHDWLIASEIVTHALHRQHPSVEPTEGR